MTGELTPATRAPRPPLLPRQEKFALLLAEGIDAAQAYRATHRTKRGTSPHGMRSNAFRAAHSPKIARRVLELQAEAAGDATPAIRARVLFLQRLATADPSEVARIVAESCTDCWPPESSETQPNPSCRKCRGDGTQRVVLTNTDELSPAARALLKSVRQKADGSIEVRLHDQLQAADLLNKMQGVYVERSVNVNLSVPTLGDMTREQQLEFLNSLKPAT